MSLTATRAALTCVLGLAGAVLAGCGGPPGAASPTPTPLTIDELRAGYLAAATVYNRSETAIASNENSYCSPTSPTADLTKCQQAIGADRQATITFDAAIRAVTYPGQAGIDAATLLAADASVENVMKQAETAPSLTDIATLSTQQIFPLLETAYMDAVKLRGDLGLPTSTS